MVLALRANHENLCRGGPPLAANGALLAHPRASTVRAPIRACDATHHRRFQRTQKPRFAGTQNGAVAPTRKGKENGERGQMRPKGNLVFFVSGRRPAFVSRGVGCEASGQGPCWEAASLLDGLHARTMPEAKGFHALRFRGRAQAPNPEPSRQTPPNLHPPRSRRQARPLTQSDSRRSVPGDRSRGSIPRARRGRTARRADRREQDRR